MIAAFKRQAIAEWRDEQILAAVALVGHSVENVRIALEEDFRKATAKDALFPRTAANARIDTMTAQMLKPAIEHFLASAGLTLCQIDSSLAPHADGLKSLNLDENMAVPELAKEVEAEIFAIEDQPETDEGRLAWLSTLPGRIKKKATDIAESAGNVSDVLISEKLGLSDRIRVMANKVVEREWADADNPKSVLTKLVQALDEVSRNARVSLL